MCEPSPSYVRRGQVWRRIIGAKEVKVIGVNAKTVRYLPMECAQDAAPANYAAPRWAFLRDYERVLD